MGVWIETLNIHFRKIFIIVTPCVGVWIETEVFDETIIKDRHTLRGCVD